MKTILLMAVVTSVAHAQATPERTLGAPTVIGSEPFWNIASVRELSDGRVIVVQHGPMDAAFRSFMSAAIKAAGAGAGAGRGGRGAIPDSAMMPQEPPTARVVLYDAKLKSITPIGRAGTGPNEYHQPDRLLPSIADTTLLTEQSAGDLLVIDPNGKIVATRPAPGGIGAMIDITGAAIDQSGRFLYEPRVQTSRHTAAGTEMGAPDSAAVLAFDFKTGGTIPVAQVRVPGTMSLMQTDPATPGVMKMRVKTTPFPVIDDWVMMPDGTLAIIRGADLHIDWIAPDGKRRSTLPISYARVAVTDSDKVKFVEQLHKIDSMTASMPMLPRSMSMQQLEPDSFPRFKPPFSMRGARAASDGTIWLPSKIISPAAPEGWAVIGPDGKVREIVHLASGQRLLGFGKGVVYVAVNGSRVARVAMH